MPRSSIAAQGFLIALGAALLIGLLGPRARSAPVPAYRSSSTAAAPTAATEIAILAGGCFWGVDAVFKHVRGVSKVVSGYAGGNQSTADYEVVSSGATGHAESVQVTFDPRLVSYAQLLQIFFSVAHDPTELNRQGPDRGTQYRSAIFYSSDAQQQTARAYIEQLDSAKIFATRIVTEVTPLKKFYPAEAYHQNYLALHPHQPYIVINDLPKVAALRSEYPTLYQP
jgi:peptide-methionine (S)-S-oxide reductase